MQMCAMERTTPAEDTTLGERRGRAKLFIQTTLQFTRLKYQMVILFWNEMMSYQNILTFVGHPKSVCQTQQVKFSVETKHTCK